MRADLSNPTSTRSIDSVSVLIPTCQGSAFLDRVLERLREQVGAPQWDLWVIDSGSTDETLELLRRHRIDFPVPMHVTKIHPAEFDHGDTRNQLAATSTGDLLVYLTQDAIPAGSHWLATLVRNFDDPGVAAAYCRNLPRPDADPVTRLLSRDDPSYAGERREVTLPPLPQYEAMDAHAKRELYDFNNVASAIRREVWERHPFPRTSFGEDILIARAILEAGHTIAFDPASAVEHSHDYDAEQMFERAFVDGRFNAEWLGRMCVASERDAATLEERFATRDTVAIDELGLSGTDAEALNTRVRELRRAVFQGLHAGGRDALASCVRPASRMLEDPMLDVLYVVHGFPPQSWAGTEVYTLNLAREIQRRGHRVTVLTRSAPTSPSEADYRVSEREHEGLRVITVSNGLDHASVADTYQDRRVEALFRTLLEENDFDVVHFQHLIHASVGMIDIAKRAGAATVIHCHDYWPLCARVQMIRPDGVRCEREMGLGCHACVQGERLDTVEAWGGRTERVAPWLDLAARIAKRSFFGKRTRDRARYYEDMRKRGPAVRAAYAASDLALVPSRTLRDRLLASGDFDPETLVYSPNGTQVSGEANREKTLDPSGRLRIGYVGTLAWYKGVDVLLHAMARLPASRVTLAIHGDYRPEADDHHAHLREIAPPNARFHGPFDNRRLAEIHRELDLLVVPSLWYENDPVTIREAFALGTPVIASDLGGMAESVEPGCGGLRFPVGDHEALAACLERFLREPSLAKELASRAPRVKTILEDAVLSEARYRSLCARHRAGEGVS